MAEIEIRLPKMGESVTEATITNWLKQVGDTVALDEPLVEVATDKVDNELPSEAAGILIKHQRICFSEIPVNVPPFVSPFCLNPVGSYRSIYLHGK